MKTTMHPKSIEAKRLKIISELQSTLRKISKDRWTYLGDIWDLEKVIKLLEAGKIKQAANILDDLDTAARDNLRDSTWKWVMDTLYPES